MRHHYLAAAALFLGLASTREARAAQVFSSDCNFGVQDVWGIGSTVCATGDADKIPPGKICPEAYVIVVPKGATVGDPLKADVTGGPNYVAGCSLGGAFYDQLVWGSALAGEYEMILDHYPFGTGLGPEDLRDGTFKVISGPPTNNIDLAAVKGAAQSALDKTNTLQYAINIYEYYEWAKGWYDNIKGGVELVKSPTVIGFAGYAGGIALGVLEIETNYNAFVLQKGMEIIKGQLDTLGKRYKGIVDDPPDPNFLPLVAVDMSEVLASQASFSPLSSDPDVALRFAIAQRVAIQGAAYKALIPSTEKLQGALASTAEQAALGRTLQARQVKAYAGLALAAGDAMLADADALEAHWASLGVAAEVVDGAQIKAEIDAVVAGDFDESDKNVLRSLGADDAAMAAIRAELGKLVIPPSIGRKVWLDLARQTHLAIQPQLAALIAQADKILAENQAKTFAIHPDATLSVPASGKAGQPLALSASASHYNSSLTPSLSYGWDLDADGAFDDASGKDASLTPQAPGSALISLRVADPDGRAALRVALVPVEAGNAPPAITSYSPDNTGPLAAVGEAVDLSVVASDPDGDPLSFSWSVDGQDAGSGSSFSFVMPDEQVHRVRVLVSDGKSPAARMGFNVRAKKWNDPGSGGAGGAAGGAAGGGAGGDAGGDAGSGGQASGGAAGQGGAAGGDPAGAGGAAGSAGSGAGSGGAGAGQAGAGQAGAGGEAAGGAAGEAGAGGEGAGAGGEAAGAGGGAAGQAGGAGEASAGQAGAGAGAGSAGAGGQGGAGAGGQGGAASGAGGGSGAGSSGGPSAGGAGQAGGALAGGSGGVAASGAGGQAAGGPAAGAGGQAGSKAPGGAGAAAGSPAQGAGAGDAPQAAEGDDGCGCAVPGRPFGSSGLVALLALLAARRRRARG